MSTVLTRPERTERKLTGRKPTGRHRLGRPGLIPATALVTVVRRGFFGSLLRRGRHRWTAATIAARTPTKLPTPAAARDSALKYPAAA